MRSAILSNRLRHTLAIGAALSLALTFGACSGSDDDSEDAGSDALPTQSDDSTDSSDSGDDTVATSDEADEIAAGMLDSQIEQSDSHDEVTLESGGRMVVMVTCEAMTGGTIVSASGYGMPEGIFTSEIEPRTGVDLTVQVPAGTGQGNGSSQMTLDEPSYTISYPDLEGGVEFQVDGC